MDFNINKSAVKSHARVLFAGANLKITLQTNDEIQQNLPVYFWVQAHS